MDFTTLGGTGLRVSRMGLGCGGASCIGQNTGKTEKESIALIRYALDLGIKEVTFRRHVRGAIEGLVVGAGSAGGVGLV